MPKMITETKVLMSPGAIISGRTATVDSNKPIEYSTSRLTHDRSERAATVNRQAVVAMLIIETAQTPTCRGRPAAIAQLVVCGMYP